MEDKAIVPNVRSLLRSIPLVRRTARRTKLFIGRKLGMEQTYGRFFTLSPDVLVALVKVLEIQKAALADGQNLLANHGYYEFGMFKGFSFWFAEQITRTPAAAGLKLYGFDSFAGLSKPTLEVEARHFEGGELGCSLQEVTSNLQQWSADASRYELFKGFFSDALFQQLRAQNSFAPLSICLIDVDLYEPCIAVLNFIKPYLVKGSLLLLDDYHHFGRDVVSGENRAFAEFQIAYPEAKFEHLFDYGYEGVVFRVTSI